MKHLSGQLQQKIDEANRLLLVVHQDPDGDALGAATALREYFISLGKEAEIWSSTPVQPRYSFLPHVADVVVSNIETFSDFPDCIIVVDSSDLKYAGIAHLVKGYEHKIVNIDHHPTNQHYGVINLVEPTASSTSEIVYRILKHNGVHLNDRIATSLLTGILTDTDNFSNPATSSFSMLVASDLVRSGANINMINRHTVKNKNIETLKLWGTVLARLKKLDNSSITYTYITQKDLKDHDVPENESEGIANFLNNLDDGGVSLILRENNDGRIKGSFRTTRDDIDVSAWAKTLGGGGHKKAAGFTVEGSIQDVLNRILTLQ